MLVLLALLAAPLAAQSHLYRDRVDPAAGGFSWTPELSPQGPVAIIVSLPSQRAYVYRNGVRIGTSAISSGKPGHDTPAGIYTVLEKRREHYSNLYDNAPMPYMQRLTWGGLALHAGHLPGYPASHGCVRLPEAFAERLFAVTGPGTVVVVASAQTSPPEVVAPGLFSPVDAVTGTPRPPESDAGSGEWVPERVPEGPLTILLSIADRQLVVLRNAVEIGRSGVTVDASLPRIGTRAYLLLDGATGALPSDRPALHWLALPMPNDPAETRDLVRQAFDSGRIAVPHEFALRLYDELRPGTTAIVTDEPLQPRESPIDVLESGSSD